MDRFDYGILKIKLVSKKSLPIGRNLTRLSLTLLSTRHSRLSPAVGRTRLPKYLFESRYV